MNTQGILAPSLLGADFLNLETDLKIIKKNPNLWLHLDIMDGHFVPNISFGPQLIEKVRQFLGNLIFFDVHLMVNHPESYLERISSIPIQNFTFHFECCTHHDRLIQQIKEKKISAGVAIVPSTPIENLSYILPLVDIVLVMSVNPGFGNQKFIPYITEKIESLKKIRDKKKLKFRIQVDGGINSQTLPIVKRAGADIFVSGSSFFSSIKESNNLINLIR